MILHYRFGLIRLKDRLNKNLSHCYTLLEDIEMFFDAMAIII
jgi:hypothetical protein